MKKYQFRREDNGKIVLVPFEDMMQQDSAGFITLEDGVAAKRVHALDTVSNERKREVGSGTKPIPPSDAMGFTAHQHAEFEADRRAHGFSGVEFVKDPMEPTFFQVKCSDRRTWDRYVRHRGFVDKNRTSGVSISEQDLEKARVLVSR